MDETAVQFVLVKRDATRRWGNRMKYHVIAIEREFASGGQEIGNSVAKRLGIPCYGREILKMAADKIGTSLEYLENMEEKATGSVLYSMYMIASLGQGGNLSGEKELMLTESEIIRKLTQTPAVLVGRCAVDALKEREDVLRVFIRSDAAVRKKRAVEVYDIPQGGADAALRRADKRRSGYYKANTGRNWNDFSNYHVILDSGLLGIDRCVDILETCCR